ncbi:MAG TPA: sigma-70 family RNA polymerase sigma factor [Tepidisphaeraceae bacterium]|jgi:RNA polymerase sigma-70 factor (ECF subfamily)|nr:sigma-70 family RNA polymerase sigma factor [Tepidisphaeraceae bacterium]
MISADNDLVLLRRFTERGDQAAFSEIVRRYAGMVFSVSRRILNDRARAEEVSQETFYRLMTRPQSVSQSLGGWLHKAATRLAVDEQRADSARRRREAQVAAEMREEGPAGDDGPRWADVSPHVDEALSALPEDERELLVRHFLRGEAQADLAAEGGTSAATLSRRMKSAVDLLRRELRRRGVDVAPALLPVLFARHAIEATPHALLTELGKMAMVGGSHGAGGLLTALAGRAAAACNSSLAAKWGGIAAALFTGLLVTALVLAVRPGVIQRMMRPESETAAVVAKPAPTASSAEGSAVRVPGPDTLDSNRVALFQRNVGDRVTVVFADNHTQSLPLKEARALLAAQTGKTLEQLTREGPPATMP